MPVPERREAVERRLLRDSAYTAVCAAIVDGSFQPGEVLHDNELCSWLSLSRTPVRDALARLEDEGLVETAPQRYTRVTPVRPHDAQAIFPVLAALHALAAELAVPRLARADHAALRAANDSFVEALRRGHPADAHAADHRFHDVFVRAAGNDEVVRSLGRIAPRLRRLAALHRGALPGRRSVAQHEAIIMRAAAGDPVRTASATRENWLELGGLLERALAATRTA